MSALTRRAALAAIPGAAASSCLAEDTAARIEVPARLNRNRQIVIPVSINGSGQLWCLLDTGGANLLYLRPAKAAEMGITASSEAFSSGALDTSSRAGGRALVALDVGAVHRTNQGLYIKDFQSRDDGVIGSAVFADYVVELDFRTPALRLHAPASFPYRGHSTPIACDLWSFNPQVLVSLTLDDSDPVKARMTVDSGAGGIADAFVTPRFNEQLRRQGRSIRWAPDKEGWSTCRIRRITLGANGMDNPLVVLPPVQGFGGDTNAPDGMLAVKILRQYRIYIDYAKKQTIFDPNPADGRVDARAAGG